MKQLLFFFVSVLSYITTFAQCKDGPAVNTNITAGLRSCYG